MSHAHATASPQRRRQVTTTPTPLRLLKFELPKSKLPFTLLCDVGAGVADRYGVWREKKNYGRTSMGVVRTTFLLDEAGIVFKVFRSVKVDGHAEEVLASM